MINESCGDVQYPANGKCNQGWSYWVGGGWQRDNTIQIWCTGIQSSTNCMCIIILLSIIMVMNLVMVQ